MNKIDEDEIITLIDIVYDANIKYINGNMSGANREYKKLMKEGKLHYIFSGDINKSYKILPWPHSQWFCRSVKIDEEKRLFNLAYNKPNEILTVKSDIKRK